MNPTIFKWFIKLSILSDNSVSLQYATVISEIDHKNSYNV